MIDCPGCAAIGADPALASVHHCVEPRTQFASPELIEAIVYAGHDAGDDPRWRESGARDRAHYGFWASRSCGIVCLQMVLEHHGRPVPLLVDAAEAALAAGCYRPRPDGGLDGLLYQPFVEHTRDRYGLDVTVETSLTLDGITAALGSGRLVVASVHPSLRRPEQPAAGRGGHLVLVTGIENEQGSTAAAVLHVNNPSGHRESSRRAVLCWTEFELFFARRGMTVPARPDRGVRRLFG
ncbi:MAG: C39 family peptidase [Nocardioides sp.]|uniref:C39 family peptidase n=1 Tax=Nocardioides sp. TaxID=35761 RepID=UPI0039E3669F